MSDLTLNNIITRQNIKFIAKFFVFIIEKYFQMILITVVTIIIFAIFVPKLEDDLYLEIAWTFINMFLKFLELFIIRLFDLVKNISLYFVIFYGLKRFYDYQESKLINVAVRELTVEEDQ